MITTYAVSLTKIDAKPADHITLCDIVDDWLVENYPMDSYAPGTSVRSRSDDAVFRLSITVSAPHSVYVETLTVTVVLIETRLTFDIRNVSTPTTTKVIPYTPNTLLPHIVRLVQRVVNTVPTDDANRWISEKTTAVITELDGQAAAAFVLAPARRLPVIIEITDTTQPRPPLLGAAAGPLVGLVHMFHILNKEALQGFSDFTNYSLIGPGCIIIQWAGRTEPVIVHRNEIAPSSERYERDRLIRLIIDTAARSVASPRVPPPPQLDIETDSSSVQQGIVATDTDAAVHIEQLQASNDTLEASLADADRIVADLRSTLEHKGGQLDELILRNVSLEMQAGHTPQVRAVASMTEALRLAQQHCPFLIFHPRAIETGERLEGPEPVSVLQDLVRLNEVARAWMSREITGTSIKLACRQMGLDFSPSISATARQKFDEDYLIDWRGKTVTAEAHIRRGKKAHLVRIYLYFDEETQQVVVAYIGRHLRDKGSAS